MDMSEQTAELFTAVSKFQGELSNASKDKQGHGYKYATLAQCIDVAKDPLLKNHLAVVQLMGDSDNGTTLTTMLTHASGQWLRSEFLMEKAVLQGGAGKNPAQVMGAKITYMRRYSYAAIIGMAQEDDDATDVGSKSQTPKPAGKQVYKLTDSELDSITSAVQSGLLPADVITQLEQSYIVTHEVKNTINQINKSQ